MEVGLRSSCFMVCAAAWVRRRSLKGFHSCAMKKEEINHFINLCALISFVMFSMPTHLRVPAKDSRTHRVE